MAGLYRRGKVWWARAQSAGREFRRSLKTSDRQIAERRLRDWLDDLNSSRWGDRPKRSFEETAERFVREHLTVLKPRAAQRYGVSLKQLVRTFAGITIEKIGTAELSTFETLRRGDGVAPPSIRRDLACLSSMLTSAIDWEWIDVNPVPAYLRRRSRRGLKEGNPHTRYLTESEEAAILRHATGMTSMAFILAIDTGLRQDELFSLQWDQVDMARWIIRTTTKTKSGRLRAVPLPERSRTILGTLPRHIDSPYVLVNWRTGTRFLHLNRALEGARRQAGVKALCWHDLRRTAGCRWLQRDGRSMAEVSTLLGHSSIAVTERSYAFLDAEQIAESVSGRTKTGTWTAD